MRRGVTVARERWLAAGLLALFVLAYLWPALVGGKVLLPTAGMYNNTPWRAFAPAGFEAYVNRQLEDVTLSLYPWQVLARQLIHAGTFPAWDPNAFAGTPFLANPEVAWFSPFSALLWILPLNSALGIVAALKLWLAGLGTYLLVRELGLSLWPALLGAVSFALCAFDVVWLAHGVQVTVAAMLPWLLWLAERIVRRGRARDGLLLGGVVVLVLTGGHPGTQLHVLSAAVLYALLRTALTSDLARRERLRRLGLVGAGIALGALVSAVALLPAQQGAIGTAGAFARRGGKIEFTGSHMPFGVLRTALFPDWWGRPRVAIAPGPADYNERTFYAGAAALVLAALALATRDGWRRKAPFAALAALGLAVPLHAPGTDALLRHLPLFEVVQNQRMLLWFLMAVAVLAAFGLQSVLDAPRRRAVWAVLAAALAAALLALAVIAPTGGVWSQALHAFLHRAERPLEADEPALALASVGWWSVLVLALGVLLLLARLRPQRRRLVGALVVLLAALDMLHFAHGWQPMAPAATAVPPATPAIAYLQRHVRDGRVAGLTYTLLADFSNVYGLHDARGYDQPQPSLAFFHLWQMGVPDQQPDTAYLVHDASVASLHVLGALGARYLIVEPGARSNRSSLLSTAYRGADATILENHFAMQRAIVATHVRASSEEGQRLVTLAEPGFDPRHEVVAPPDGLGAAATTDGAGSVRVVRERNAQVTLRAQVAHPALVVLDDTWAPGWSVTVDGRPARALQPDLVLRGVVVPAGAHEIVWSYRVPGLRLGAALSALGLLAAAGWAGALVALARRRRRRPARAG